MQHRVCFSTFFVLCCFLPNIRCYATFQGSDALQGQWSATPIILENNAHTYDEIFEGIIVDESCNCNKTGLVVLVSFFQRAYEHLTRRQQREGAAAVLLSGMPGDDSPGQPNFQLDGTGTADIFIPMYSLLNKDYLVIAPVIKDAPIGSISVRLDPNEQNVWAEANDAGYTLFIQAFIAAGSGVNIGIAIWKFVLWAKFRTSSSPLIPLCLGLILMGNAERFLYWAIDPLWIRRRWTTPIQNLLLTLSCPFTFSTMILIVMYWYHLLTENEIRKLQSTFLGKLNTPVIIVIAFLLLSEIAMGVTRAMQIYLPLTGTSDAIFSAISGVIYALTGLILAIFFFITAHKLRNFLNEKAERWSIPRERLRKIMTYFTVIGIGSVMFIAMAAGTGIVREPMAFRVVFFLAFVGLNVQDLAMTLIFEFNNKPSSTDRSKSSGKHSGSADPTARGTSIQASPRDNVV